MRSRRDSDSALTAWKKNAVSVGQTRANTMAISGILQNLGRLRKRILPGTPTVTIPEPMHPFKIYQPDLSSFSNDPQIYQDQGPKRAIYYGADGLPVLVPIDPTKPTNLPITVNPNTDAWRLWAVRNGMIERRSLYYPALTTEPSNNYAQLINIYDMNQVGFWGSLLGTNCRTRMSGTDGLGGYKYETANDFDDPTTQIAWEGDVFVLGDNATNLTQGFFFIEIMPEFYPIPSGTAYLNAGLISVKYVQGIGQPSDSPNIIPVGFVDGNAKYGCFASQYLFDHLVNRYPVGNMFTGDGSAPASRQMIPGGAIYRGCWQTDADLVNQYFYPGDVIYYTPDTTTTITKSGVSLVLSKSYWLMATAVVKPAGEPFGDPSFLIIGDQITDVAFPP